MKVTLSDILPQAAKAEYAIAGFNVFSIDWARAVIRAAERADSPVIIMTNKSMLAHLPPAYCGPILADMAKNSAVPVCLHLDHSTEYATIQSAIENGYSSIMFDGSKYSLKENIECTKVARKMAQKKGVSLEGEVGTVRYIDIPETSTEYTDPQEAQIFVEQTKVDALAVSVGTTHRMESQGAEIQYDRIREIEVYVETPLVIHGTSGIRIEDLMTLKRYQIAKFNIGTVLRQAFAQSLRETLQHDSHVFDLFDMTEASYEAVECRAFEMLKVLR